jgi:hypothetical protein
VPFETSLEKLERVWLVRKNVELAKPLSEGVVFGNLTRFFIFRDANKAEA